MSQPFSILHISDLHRSKEDPISNEELISALIGDRDRYVNEEPRIKEPDAIIVSGDLIQGVPLSFLKYDEELKEQYQVAKQFLEELVKRFLSGDKSRIILIPGNHDIDWNTAFASMTAFENDKIPENFSKSLFSEYSQYRWDWKKRVAYEIKDQSLYGKRLEAYWAFFEEFYNNVPGLLNVKARSDVNLFSLHQNKIGVAAFNSCEGNDCFAFHGAIKKESIATSHLSFRDNENFGLLIAVWHHNIDGPPYRSDYMDVEIVKGMIGRGFRIGLCGHQHKAQATPYQIWLPSQERMAVITAGSLCAGRKELPRGINRQYNMLEIAEDLSSVKVHVREMSVANLFGRGSFSELGGKTFSELSWELPKNSVGQHVDRDLLNRRKIVDDAEKFVSNGDLQKANELLSNLNLNQSSYPRGLYLELSRRLENWSTIVKIIDPPFSIDELVLKFNALIKTKKVKLAQDFLNAYASPLNLDVATERELRNRLVSF